jgi:integrase
MLDRCAREGCLGGFVIHVEGGKGGKDRYLMPSARLLDVLRNYWRTANPREFLFPSDLPGQAISTFAVQHDCKKARQSSGIGKPITPHSLCHAFAIHLLCLTLLPICVASNCYLGTAIRKRCFGPSSVL